MSDSKMFFARGKHLHEKSQVNEGWAKPPATVWEKHKCELQRGTSSFICKKINQKNKVWIVLKRCSEYCEMSKIL
jgi:hypothetical protein